MATREELYDALRAAHAAGNAEQVEKLSAFIESMPAGASDTQAEASKPQGKRNEPLSFKRAATMPFEGFNEFLSDLVGLPGDMVEHYGGTDVPVLGKIPTSKEIYHPFRGPYPGGPRNQAERALKGGGKFAAEALATGGPMTGLAKQGMKLAGQTGAAATMPLRTAAAEMFSKPMLGAETASGFGAGVGATIGGENGGDTGAMVGGLVGGLAPGLVPHTPVAKVGKKVFERFTYFGDKGKARAKNVVHDKIGGALSPEEAAQAQHAKNAQALEPEFNPSGYEATGSAALKQEQQALEGRMHSSDLERTVARAGKNQALMSQAKKRLGPDESTEDITVIFDEVKGQKRSMVDEIEGEQSVLANERAAIGDEAPSIDRYETGERLRTQIDEVRETAKAEMNIRAAELGLDDASPEIDAASIFNQLLVKFKPERYDAKAELPEVFKDISDDLDAMRGIKRRGDKIEEVTPMPQPSFKQWMNLRRRIGSDIRNEIAKSQTNKEVIGSLVGARNFLDDQFATQMAHKNDAVADNWSTFRDEYYEGFVKKFENNTATKARDKNNRAFYTTSNENMSRMFFKKGDVSAAKYYKEMFGNDDMSVHEMESIVLDRLRDEAMVDGVIDPGKFKRFQKGYRSVLDEFPDIRNKIDDIGSRNQALLERSGELDLRTKTIQTKAIYKIVDKVTGLGSTPEAGMAQIMKDDRLLAQFMAEARKSPEALAGARRHVWDGLDEKTPGPMLDYIEANRKSLTRILGKEHVDVLEVIGHGMVVAQRAPKDPGTATATNEFDQWTKEQLGTTAKDAVNLAYQAKFLMSTRWAGTKLASNFQKARGLRNHDALMQEALYHKNVADHVGRVVRANGESPEVRKKLNWFLYNLGLDPNDTEDDR